MSNHAAEIKFLRNEFRSRCGILPKVEEALDKIAECGVVKHAEVKVEDEVETISVPSVSEPSKSFTYFKKGRKDA